MRVTRTALAIGVAAALASSVDFARANPKDVYGFGARAPAMGGAMTAAATDGSANYYNPAILATFEKIRLDIGYQAAKPKLSLNGNDVGVDMSRGLALSLNVPGSVGGVRVAFGGGLFLPDESISRVRTLNGQQPRFQLYDNRPQRMFLAANVAVQLTSRLWVGGGLSYMSSTKGSVFLTGRLGFPDADDSDLATSIDVDLQTVRYGQFGGLYQLNSWLKVGASFRSEFKVRISQDFIIEGDVGPAGREPVVENGSLRLSSRAEDLFQPAQYTIGFDAKVSERLSVAFDAAFQRWSRFTNPAARVDLVLDVGDFNALIDIPDAPPQPKPHFSDILVPRFGFEWLASHSHNRDWQLRGGYAYEASPAPEQIGESNFVDNDKHTLSLGGGLTLRRFSNILLSPLNLDVYVAVTALEPRTNQKLSPVDPVGDYKATGYVLAGGIGSRWKF